MNMQELTNKTQLDAKTLSAILDAANIPNDLNDYTDEHFEIIRALQEIRKDKKVQTWPEAFVIYIKPIREIQLEEIAVRHAIAHDRIPEILAGMKLNPETMTDEQLTLFKTVCQQLQSGIAFDMAVQSVTLQKQNKGKKTTTQTMPEFASQQEPGSAIAPTKDKPMPGLVPRSVQPVDLTGIPVDDGVANNWDDVAKVGAASDADNLAGAPFDGIIEGSEYVNDKTEALKQHGFNLYMEKFDEAMHDPELVKRVEDKYLGKFPARWNLKPKN
jgi:hypothetical protein